MIPERLGPFAQRAVARDLIVLDGLAAAEHRRVSGDLARGLGDDAVALLEQAFDGIALLALGRLSD